jgi:hypothetical protein
VNTVPRLRLMKHQIVLYSIAALPGDKRTSLFPATMLTTVVIRFKVQALVIAIKKLYSTLQY